MKTPEAITTPILTQQNNYNGVKIDIHNPTVNVPANNQGYAQPDIQIYNYENKKLPPEYCQQFYTQDKPKQKPQVINVTSVPDAKPVPKLPESVLEPLKVVPVPEPVYVEPPKTVAPETVSAVVEQKTPEEISVPEAVLTPVQPEVAPKAQQIAEPAPIAEPVMVQTPPKAEVQIIPPVEAEPAVDFIKVSENLENKDYDVQALQMKEICEAALNPDKDAIKPYLVEQIFLDVIDIVSKDTSTLAGPTDAQNAIRERIMENFIAQKQQEMNNIPPEQIKLPHVISEQDLNYANALAPLELAERNKEYGMTTLAVLSDAFLKRVEAETGEIVPVTDVPGLSAIVNSLKSENVTVRLAAMDALIFLQRPEYARELTPIYQALMTSDPDETMKNVAQFALEKLNAPVVQAA